MVNVHLTASGTIVTSFDLTLRLTALLLLETIETKGSSVEATEPRQLIKPVVLFVKRAAGG